THAVMSSATALMISLSKKNITPPRSPLRRLSHLRFRLLQPVRHPHLAVHRRRGGEVLLHLLALARALVELAEAEMAVGDERGHAGLVGERRGLLVVSLAALGVEPVGMGRDVAQEMLSMGSRPWMTRRVFNRTLCQASGLVEPAEQQAGA